MGDCEGRYGHAERHKEESDKAHGTDSARHTGSWSAGRLGSDVSEGGDALPVLGGSPVAVARQRPLLCHPCVVFEPGR